MTQRKVKVRVPKKGSAASKSSRTSGTKAKSRTRKPHKKTPPVYSPPMQHVLNTQLILKSQSGSMAAKHIAASIALPWVTETARCADIYRTKKTAVTQLHKVTTVTWEPTLPLTASQKWKDGEYVTAVSKDPLHAVAFSSRYREQLGGVYVGYTYHFEFNFNGLLTQTTPINYESGEYNIVPVLMKPDVGGAGQPASTNNLPFGTVYYPFTEVGRVGFYLAANTRITVSITAGVWPLTISLNTRRWNGSAWELFASQIPVLGNIITNVSEGYFTFALNNEGAPLPPASFRVTILGQAGGLGDGWGFYPLPQIETQIGLTDIRTAGASLMTSPLAPLLTATGRIVGYQSVPFSFVGEFQNFDEIAVQSDSSIMPYLKGMYAFHKPAGPQETELCRVIVDEVVSTGAVFEAANAPIMNPSGWLYQAVSVPFSSGTAPSDTVYITTNFGVEFMTTNQWYPLSVPRFTTSEYAAAMRMLAALPQFHDNPFHFSDIINFLRKGMSIFSKVAPPIAAGLSLAFPEFSPVLAPLGAAGQAMAKYNF